VAGDGARARIELEDLVGVAEGGKELAVERRDADELRAAGDYGIDVVAGDGARARIELEVKGAAKSLPSSAVMKWNFP